MFELSLLLSCYKYHCSKCPVLFFFLLWGTTLTTSCLPDRCFVAELYPHPSIPDLCGDVYFSCECELLAATAKLFCKMAPLFYVSPWTVCKFLFFFSTLAKLCYSVLRMNPEPWGCWGSALNLSYIAGLIPVSKLCLGDCAVIFLPQPPKQQFP